MITKEELDALAAKYETKDFIKDDPIQFLHRFNDKGKEDAELAGFMVILPISKEWNIDLQKITI